MKLQTSLKIAAAAAALCFGANRPVAAQTMATVPSDMAPGLIGETYTGVEFGYTHRTDGPPDVMHRYGAIVSQPINDELNHTDAAVRYNYTRSSANGILGQAHEFAASLLHYVPVGGVKPFIEGQLGFAWTRGATDGNSVMYAGTAGVEMLMSPRVALTPFAQFKSMPRLHDDVWNYGAKLTFRVERGWSASVGIHFVDADGAEFTLGIQRRY
jgi:hypothetical protein